MPSSAQRREGTERRASWRRLARDTRSIGSRRWTPIATPPSAWPCGRAAPARGMLPGSPRPPRRRGGRGGRGRGGGGGAPPRPPPPGATPAAAATETETEEERADTSESEDDSESD